MSQSRRQRHRLLLLLLTSSFLLATSTKLQMVNCQQQSSPLILHLSQQQQQQYRQQRSSPSNAYNNNNLPLVNDRSPRLAAAVAAAAQSLPLIRQQQQQAELDNVIESTTATMLLQQQQQQLINGAFMPARLISSSVAAGASIISQASCQLPPTWTGKWYQSNKEPIRVTNTEISDKGVCRDQKGDKYLFEYLGGKSSNNLQANGGGGGPCLVCLVINERHLNVLQYKESSCQPIPANYRNRSLAASAIANNNNNNNQIPLDDDHSLLDSICSDITGDAQLESLFRLDTPPIECPITGQYSFNYDSCREPQSSLDSCIDKKQLNFKFSACPDVPGSESKSEVLKCYADWSEGNNYYMIGRFEQASNHQDKGKFRCFVYEKSVDGKFIQMAQSLEESCYGLINANEGPKTLRLTAKPPTIHKCHFPSYIQSLSENWLSVDNLLIYMFNQNSTKYQVKETKEGDIIEEASCLQQFTYPPTQAQAQQHSHSHPHLHHTRSNSNQPPQQQVIANRRFPTTTTTTSTYPQADQSSYQQVTTKTSATNDVVYLVQITKNCQTANYCVRFYKRSNGIVQIDYFMSQPGDGQCRHALIGTPQTQIITSTNLEHQRCPFEGAYTIEAPIESDLTYNPSNIFICPRQSFLTAQCDHPSRLRIHSKCSPAKYSIKNLYCLGSWTTNNLVRLLLADDDRQRYSAWYRDYGSLQPAIQKDGSPTITNLEAQAQIQGASNAIITRSQQILAASGVTNPPQTSNLAPIVDLQIALITPLPTVAKPMQVRLTRRNQCSELRGYSSHGAFSNNNQPGSGNNPMSSSYASSAKSTAAPSAFASVAKWIQHSHSSLLILIVTSLMPSWLIARHS